MLKIGIIGAGSISESHIDCYINNDDCEVVAIADINIELAHERASKYGIKKVFADYRELLKDKHVDAVSIVTPTFTHKDIVVDALKSGKHVLCEKPPALNADEVRECQKVANETGNLLMFAFVCRFRSQVQYLKKYIDAGKMGKIVSAECGRVMRCIGSEGWFIRREKGGGCLMDSAVHELDNALYLMGYPRPKSVIASQTFVNGDLFGKMNSAKFCWKSKDLNKYERNIESAISAFVTLDNGASLYIKAATALNSVMPGVWVDICGEKSGARIDAFANNKKGTLDILEITDNYYFSETTPILDNVNIFEDEINHFVDCCVNNTECICKVEEAVILMEIINAAYKSAESGLPVIF